VDVAACWLAIAHEYGAIIILQNGLRQTRQDAPGSMGSSLETRGPAPKNARKIVSELILGNTGL
jgi:hypothetical protein